MAAIQAIPGLLTGMGIDPQPIIAEARLDPALFDDPENTIPFHDLGRFVDLCVTRADCPDLGLRVGETMTPEVLGQVGALASSAADLRGALSSIVQYLHFHDRGALPALRVSGDRAVLSYLIHEPNVLATEQIYDAALLHAHNILKVLAGPSWQVDEVRFSRLPPEHVESYQRRFGTRVRFGAEDNALLFSASWLDRPVVSADAQTHYALIQLVEILDRRVSGDLVAHLRHTLRKLLSRDVGEQALLLDQVLREYPLHRRTLNRRLRERDSSFKALLGEARYDIARQLLRDTNLTSLRIAGMLGYADSTAFTRAFRRWSGTTPAAWRRAHKHV